MKYGDTSRLGRPFAKDPAVVRFAGRYWLYYSMPPYAPALAPPQAPQGWGIGIAQSQDLTHWDKVGELTPGAAYEAKGICAPGAIVLRGQVHLFYQTYGNFPKDAICHATSADGIHFVRDASNPIFAPHGDWTNGRAIDAEVIPFHDRLLLYFATRDPAGKIQKIGVASAPLDSDFSRAQWRQEVDKAILEPQLPWEQDCIEAPAVCQMNGKLYLFYAGAYNNAPQQIGCAVSEDGIHYTRLFTQPCLPNGQAGAWNSSESGHPFLFHDADGRTYLFFQGNNDKGKTWYLTQTEVGWQQGLPYLLQPAA